ncbi:MAG: tetratricopeptide repeat protein [Deltaproteobacteria bacterium]|nr:tetratricopeptide repeat protein [Deltaproteobacteria bacterium]
MMNDFNDGISSCSQSQGALSLVLNKMKQEGRVDDIINMCIKALSASPDYFPPGNLLAEIFFEEGFFDEAEAELLRVVSVMESSIWAYKLQAEIHIRQKRYRQAFEALKRYLAHKSDDSEAFDLLRKIITPDDSGKKLIEDKSFADMSVPPGAAANGADDEDVFSEFATPTLAEIFFDQGQISDAIHTYEQVLKNNPDDTIAARRLVELKSLINEDAGIEDMKRDEGRLTKLKMISFLEGWLHRIKESKNAE